MLPLSTRCFKEQKDRNTQQKSRTLRERGAALINSLVFTVIAAMMIAGMGQLTLSHFVRSIDETNLSKALDIAEAGINYELHKISSDANTADQYPGASYNFNDGAFNVKVTNRDGTYPWTPGNPLLITSVGNFRGLTRTVQITAKAVGYSTTETGYAVYSVDWGTLNSKSIVITGNIGTDCGFTLHKDMSISGEIHFNGVTGSVPSKLASKKREFPNPYAPKQVNTIALELFPNSGATAPGGLDYVSIRNDNNRANPPVSGNNLYKSSGTVTLYGPGDYYFDNMELSGSAKLVLDNTGGPIRLWFNPCAYVAFLGNSKVEKLTSATEKECTFYIIHSADFKNNANVQGYYYVYGDFFGTPSGVVTMRNAAKIYGRLIGYSVSIANTNQVHYNVGTGSGTVQYYAFDNQWIELNPVY